ncbi:MFS transporter [Glutamicibacter uratoxydans]|uniref:MFS transporter n=1 Tax=Glutamicibacter uratoxydans TaxID=43667 RepID=A0A4Y4DMX3_GLUUR|nr:MFS transporter [Glutamicibacter uratoxydans]GED05005.1 MFS transporter [Glutamicibacter uratoxydans]
MALVDRIAIEQRDKNRRRALLASVLGTTIEWYDYALYGAAASVVIGPLFFASAGESAASIAAFATFAVGFIARPLGGVVIGHLGDRFGRRPAMLLSVILMGVATVGVGLLPTANTWGTWAVILLVIFRLIQGFGAGAELTGAMTLVAEYADPKRRGLYTSFVLATPPLGIALATVCFFLVSIPGEEALLGWAWRIPFLISALLFLVAIYIRNKLEETPEYALAMAKARSKSKEAQLPLREVFTSHWRRVILGFFAITGHNAVNYIIAVFSISFMVTSGMDRTAALLAVTLGSLVSVILTPVGGLLADRYGSAKILAAGNISGVILAYPIFLLLSSGEFIFGFVAVAVGYALVIPCTSGAQGAFLTELFPVSVRFSGIAIARELNGALVAGLSPLIAAALLDLGGGSIILPAGYLALCCFASAMAIFVGVRIGNTTRY